MAPRDDHDHPGGDTHDHDLGLSHDLPLLLSRRRALTVLSGVGLATLTGCAAASSGGAAAMTSASATSDAAATAAATTAAGAQIPEETAGPFPADGSNGRNILNQSGVVRSDLTSSFGTASGVAEGVPLFVTLTVLDTANGARPLSGAAVYLWHANREGQYSMYSEAVADQNYLRGVQETDSQGQVTFTTIYPAAYDGRWPHIHFEVYPSVDAAVTASARLRTTQLAFPKEVCDLVYATPGYEASIQNLARTSLETDMVFRDGYSLQLATVTGTVADGMKATLNVPV